MVKCLACLVCGTVLMQSACLDDLEAQAERHQWRRQHRGTRIYVIGDLLDIGDKPHPTISPYSLLGVEGLTRESGALAAGGEDR
jgi:hypothetical protein